MESVRRRVELARAERALLVPVIGAGTSIPLGLPSWPALRSKLLASDERGAAGDGEAASDHLNRCRQQLGPVEFAARIQSLLTLPEEVTSTTLQALVACRCRSMVTLNLDTAIETAFEMAGRPLRPSDVLVGVGASALARFGRPHSHTSLLKLHGSIEDPDSWVLTADRYKATYIKTDRVLQFLQTQVGVPLFIGCGFADADLDHALRLRQSRWQNRGYAIVPQAMVDQRSEMFKSIGLIPIGYYDVGHIDELLDEIFDCSHPTAWRSLPRDDGPVELRVAGATVRVPGPAGAETLATVARLLANAFDFHPYLSYLDKRDRRLTGPKGQYLEELVTLVRQPAGDADAALDAEAAASATLSGLLQYPATLERSALPSLLGHALRSETDCYRFVGLLLGAAGRRRGYVVDLLLRSMDDAELPYPARRAITKQLAHQGAHPACRLPLPFVRVGDLDVTTYLLTEAQVGEAFGAERQIPRSARPYLVRNVEDVALVVERIRAVTGRRWRLPTETEWREIAHADGAGGWPWGAEDPQFRRHAHLNFVAVHHPKTRGPVEVGLFPEGRSPEGVLDLVGNVYEVVTVAPGRYVLAGGMWSTRYTPGTDLRLTIPTRRYRENTGLRLVATA